MRNDFRFELKETPDNIKIDLMDLDSDLWNKYYGACENINELIKDFISDKGEVSVEEVCLAISEQMTFYPAIYLVFPYLVEILYQNEYFFIPMVSICLSTDIEPLRILCSEDGRDIYNTLEPEVLENYNRSIEKYRLMTLRYLNENIDEIRKMDSEELGYFFTALMAMFGAKEDAYLIFMNECVNCFISCKRCGYCDEEIYLLDESRNAIKPALEPQKEWDGKRFEDTYLWVNNCLKWMGADTVRDNFSYYYGTYKCPECGKKAPVFDFIKNYFFEE